MAKNKISEWSAIPANNTDIGGIDIAEGCAPSGINNGIRELMAQVKDMITGADGDNFVVGGNLTVTGELVANGSAGTSGQVLSSRGAGLSPQYQTLNLTAAGISNTPAGNISATNVQAAIDELDTEKQAALGFTPVQQNGGSGQLSNKVYVGWSGSGLKAQVDGTDLGVLWTNGYNSAIGYGQSWQNVGGSRAQDVTYTNSTGRPIFVSVSVRRVTNNDAYLYVNGVQAGWVGGGVISGLAFDGQLSAIVPNGSSYYVTGANTIGYWAELR